MSDSQKVTTVNVTAVGRGNVLLVRRPDVFKTVTDVKLTRDYDSKTHQEIKGVTLYFNYHEPIKYKITDTVLKVQAV